MIMRGRSLHGMGFFLVFWVSAGAEDSDTLFSCLGMAWRYGARGWSFVQKVVILYDVLYE